MIRSVQLVVVLGFLASLTNLTGQAPAGNISGVVKDPSGAVISAASATAMSIATGASRSVMSDDQGYFLITMLQPGTYDLTVVSQGFSDFHARRIAVAVGQTASLDIQLAVSSSATQVDVSAESQGVNTEQTSVSGVITTKQIDELPLNGRNYLELARLEPGVEIQQGQSFDPTKTRYTGVSIGGRSGREARITLDGIDVVDEHVGTTTLNISQETIQEFQVSTSSSDASAGLSATGTVNIISKSGSNELHGSGFIFGRGSRYAARPSLAPTKPDFDRRQYGFGAGGPVLKDKLFFFGNFENTHENSAIAVASPFFPAITSYAAPFTEESQTIRGDWNVNTNDRVFFRWSRNTNANFGGFGGNTLPSSGNVNTDVTNQWGTGLDTVLGPHVTNSARMAVTNFGNAIQRPAAAAQALAVPGAEGFRIVTGNSSLVAGPDPNTPQGTSEYFNQYRDDLTWVSGRHTVRFGGDVTLRQVSVYNFAACFPSITVNAPATTNSADLLNASIVSVTLGNCNGKRIPGTPDNTHRNTRLSWYAEDTWRLLPNLTAYFGLRYEVDTHPLNNDLSKPAIAKTILPNGTDPTPINKLNFAPHLGLAWDPANDHKTSIRFGGGMYYAGRISNLVTQERATLAAFNSGNDTITLAAASSGLFDFSRGAGTSVFDFTPALTSTLRNALPIISAGQQVYRSAPQLTVPTLQVTGSGTLISNDLKTPYSLQFNAGVQRELPMNTVLDVNLLYSRSVHEFERDVDAAHIFPGNGTPIRLGDGTLPTKQITVINSNGFARYRALTVKVDKRFSRRFQYTAAYALSRTEATAPDGLGLAQAASGLLVNNNIRANFGPAALDRTHRLVLNGIVDLPFGIRASLISTSYSGLPASIILGTADLNGDGINGTFLPGTKRGALGREVDSVAKLNTLIRAYNQSGAGKPLPRGGRAPYALELPASTRFGDSFISQDLQISKVFKVRERYQIEFTAQMFNLANISNLVGPAGLPTTAFSGTLTTIASDSTGAPTGSFKLGSNGGLLNASGNPALASVDRPTSFGSFGATRPSIPTGTGLPRASQFSARFRF